MQSSVPGVSIMITSYNYGRFLGRAIESARIQEAPGLEIVVVDNASTDDSWDIIQAAAAQDSRIRAFRHNTNIGPVANHVHGLRLTRNPKIITLSADDYLLPGHVARLLAAHVEHPEVDYVFTAYVFVDEDDRLLRYVQHPGHPRGSYFGDRNDFAALLAHDCYTTVASTLFDRENIISKFEDPAIRAGDYDYYLRLASEGKRFGFLDVAGVAIRYHKSQWTGEERYTATGQQLIDQLALLEKYVTPETYEKISGREQDIANLVLTKRSMLARYPEQTQLLEQLQPRIDRVIGSLNESRALEISKDIGETPLVSVILVANDDLHATIETIESLKRQTYSNWELVLVANGDVNVTPLLLDRARPARVRLMQHSAPRSAAVSLNDGLTLAHGVIVVYAEPGVSWTPDYLSRIARSFRAGPVDALVSAVDYIGYRVDPTTGARAEVARIENYVNNKTAADSLHVGDGVPLCAFAHRRWLVDRFGRFDERLRYLATFDFISRIVGKVRSGFDDVARVTIRKPADCVLPELLDPNGYLTALNAVYARETVSPDVTRRRERYFERLKAYLQATVNGEQPREAWRLAALLQEAALSRV